MLFMLIPVHRPKAGRGQSATLEWSQPLQLLRCCFNGFDCSGSSTIYMIHARNNASIYRSIVCVVYGRRFNFPGPNVHFAISLFLFLVKF